MTQQVSNPPKQVSQPLPRQQRHLSRAGIASLLVLVGLLLLLFTGFLLWNLSQSVTHKQGTHRYVKQTANHENNASPLLIPGNGTPTKLVIPAGRYAIYEQEKGIYSVSTTDNKTASISTPGYIYNRAVPPLLTPSGQLLYSGDGLWLTNIFNGTPKQIATLPADQVITSMVLSSDGTSVAWSTEPIDGKGNNALYAGPLENSVQVYQHDATDCPCYRVFSFLHGAGNTTLLLTDDRGDHHEVQYGLWSLNIASGPAGTPQLVLDGDDQQGPLALTPSGNTLLYSTYQGVVPAPNDSSVPLDIAALNYANSLSIASLNGGSSNAPTVNGSHTVLSEQHDLSNSAAYHWVITPLFSTDGHTLVYVVFSSDAQAPFDRHSAVYSVNVTGSGSHLSVSKPQLLATSNALFVELGAWLNDRILTFYADGTLYALDTRDGAVTSIMQTKSYARVVAIVGSV